MASGGRREGAGRKPCPPDEKMVQMTITIEAETREILKALAKEQETTAGRVIEKILRGS